MDNINIINKEKYQNTLPFPYISRADENKYKEMYKYNIT